MEKVIFDTNAYRYLVQDKELGEIDKYLHKIKAKEKKKNIETLISPIVARELLTHVADKGDPAYLKCLKAIKAMYLHNGDHKSYRILASPEMLIAKAFFKESIPSKIVTNEAIVQIAYHLAKDPSDFVFKKFQRSLNLIKEQVLSSEIEFAQNFWILVKDVDPSATGWKIFADSPKKRQALLNKIRSDETSLDFAAIYLTSVAIFLNSTGKNVVLTPHQLYDMTLEFVRIFPNVIALYKYVLESLVNSEFNMMENSRGNFLWDIQLMFNVGENSVGGDKLYFVTDDQAMIRNAIGQGAKYSILTFDEYMDYIH